MTAEPCLVAESARAPRGGDGTTDPSPPLLQFQSETALRRLGAPWGCKTLPMERLWAGLRRCFRSQAAKIAIGIIVAILAVLTLWILPPELVDVSGGKDLKGKDRVDAVANERRTVLAALAGLAAAVGLVYTALKHQLDRDSNVTERYTRAIEQLGHDSIAIRLGGLYSLDRIAADSERDRDTILEVMAAFIRNQSKRTEPENPPDTDVATTLALLTGKASWITAGKTRIPLDLTDANLTRANLTRANLTRAILTGADLTAANLGGADLTGVHLDFTNFTGARLDGANLDGANLTGANLALAHLDGAHLTGADLHGANLGGADLTLARLNGSHLGGADLTLARLGGADLTDADLADANLNGADLTRANLARAILDGADLTCAVDPDDPHDTTDSANLTLADLRGADLTDAHLAGANLTGANLTGVIGLGSVTGCKSVIGLESATGLPPGFPAPSA
ncbi:pentapeptide repeat-containing protein [Mumia sp. zg.B53]|uniref:pentapeptide repeat-containing protein n=1 Tax=Mumia sp. zg.B53 TaxID=2855449 RepID=UPI001C6E0724|nr:pentapeptide repeat-containing protein [Mumia sp. zg.B53]